MFSNRSRGALSKMPWTEKETCTDHVWCGFGPVEVAETRLVEEFASEWKTSRVQRMCHRFSWFHELIASQEIHLSGCLRHKAWCRFACSQCIAASCEVSRVLEIHVESTTLSTMQVRITTVGSSVRKILETQCCTAICDECSVVC